MSLPKYYDILGVSPSATAEELRLAYRKESLRQATEKFVSRYYHSFFILSDPVRRAEYDSVRRSRPASAFESSDNPDAEERASSYYFREFARFFTSSGTSSAEAGSASAGPNADGKHEHEGGHENGEVPQRPRPDDVFGDVFADLLEPEVNHVRKTWTVVGGAAGVALGFIVANVPGAVAGAFAGSQLGRIRDAKGKPVAQVFAGLPMAQKTQILRALAIKVLGTVV